MGSPISPIIADIVMQDLEENCLSNFDFIIPLYFRYVDDTVILILNNKIEIVTSVFNSYAARLKFTYKVEKNNSLKGRFYTSAGKSGLFFGNELQRIY